MILGIVEVHAGGKHLVLSTGQVFDIIPDEVCIAGRWCASQHVSVRRINSEQFEIFNFERHESIHALAA